MSSPDTTTTGPEPFLRITATYPAAGGRVQTIDVAMNLGDTDTLIEIEVDDEPTEADKAAVTSWVTGFVTDTIAALRGRPAPTIVIGGDAMAALAGKVTHAAGCNGDCGVPAAAPNTADGARTATTEGN